MTNVKPATDEQVARFKVRAVIGALWSDEALSLIARIDADREENAANAHLIAQGIKVVNEQAAEIAALKADQADWRKGVGFIASALGIDSLSCVDIAERGLEIRAERDALKAEVERMRLTVCRACVPTAAEPQPSGADGNASPPEGHGKKDFQITCGTRAR